MKTVKLRRILIERMLGVRGLLLDGLGSGVNVVLGPNAAGKSTLARAAGYLLWPKNAVRGISVSAQIDRDCDEYSVWVESDKCKCTHFGLEIPYPVAESPSSWAYYFGLPDLLQCEDKQIAQEVMRQIMGGLDISAACASLGFADDPVKPQGLKKEVLDTDTAVDNARKEQHRLEEDEQRLAELYADLLKARASASMIPMVECSLDLHKAQTALDDSSIRLSQCDSRAGLLRGDELERLKSLQSAEDSTGSTLEDTQNRIAEHQKNLAGLSAPHELAAEEIEDHLEKLRQAEIVTQQAEIRLASASLRKDGVTKCLPRDVPESSAIDPRGINDILEIARKCSRLRQQVESANALDGWVGPMEAVSDLNAIRNGVVCLQRWLRTPSVTNTSMNPYAVGACCAIIGLAAGLALFVNPLFALLCIVGVLGLIVMSKRTSQQSTQDIFRSEYEKLGLEIPQNWHADAVEQMAGILIQRQSKLEQEQAKQERWADNKQRLETLQRDFADAENQLITALQAIGLKVVGDETDIMLLTDAILRHRTLAMEITGMESDLHQASENSKFEIERLETLLGEKCSGYASARCAFDRCRSAIYEYNTEMERLTTALRDAKQAQEMLIRAQNDIEGLYASVELKPGDFHSLKNLLLVRDRWNEASKACMEAKSVKAAFETRLHSLIASLDNSTTLLGLYNIPKECSEIEEYLVQTAQYELSSLLANLTEFSKGIEQIINEIIGIEKSIEIVKKKHDLESLTIQRNAKRDALRLKRSESMESSIGWVLADFIRRTSTEQTQTLLSDARTRFSEFTAGEFSLELDGESQRLAACRSSDRMSLSLDQLSSGTRAQLIIAARMAYIESQESEYALPIMLDESLATSDDDRAGRIARSISNISKQGRQILYFTAQSDEVNKWERAAKDSGVEFAYLKLGNIQ